MDRVASVEQQARAALAEAGNDAALEDWRTSVLGRSGTVTTILRSIGELPEDQRRETGQAANAAKQALGVALDERREELRAAVSNANVGAIDVTLPGRPRRQGRLHPSTLTLRRILDIFGRMGFATVEGREVELDESR